ncbi:M42 family metallopeptidase [Phycisphaera mikurensis]|uniref:M42 family metallopeptidase n=1 Tax=Phycisphaera mikurensis TaxID=547188 RepID=UPI00185A7DEA|nr:M20/M25/M40 family metallo-hydrolase [Phycisphaera mikurensis]MBB6441245.1 endoglucanase [Phycisphaera mikurensis]
MKRLSETAAVPGREHRVRALLEEEAAGLFDTVTTDPLGSLVCVRSARGPAAEPPQRVMVAAHMDQIGFLVRFIDDDGFLRVQPVGGFDIRNLFARVVTICPDPADPSRDLRGLMNPGVKPVHLATEEDRKKLPDLTDLVIDTTLPAEEVKKRVKIGDMVVLDQPFVDLGPAVAGQAMDNRVACWALVEAVRKLEADATPHPCELHCVFTVQEEVGLRGALTSAYTARPHVGIAVDTTLCVDTPGGVPHQQTTAFGKGVALTVMDSASIADVGILQAFERLGEANGVPTQRSILMRGGTDAGSLQRAGVGARTFTLSVPTRNIHSVTEACHKADLEACRDLLALFLAEAVPSAPG